MGREMKWMREKWKKWKKEMQKIEIMMRKKKMIEW